MRTGSPGTPDDSSAPGPSVLGGRYELGEPLGYGGMAVVRLGTDLRLGRTIAVKVLRGDLAESPAFQARFRREARAAAGLDHPAIVKVYDAGEDTVEGALSLYIVMEYVEGQTLRQLIHTGEMAPERALEVTAGILDGLAHSHAAGIVHRDIKPANVMVTPSGGVKVMDFGVARAVADMSASLTQTSAVIGTAHYLSPEQARGESVDARSDVYSTGCLLYELLTGRPPFQGDSAIAVAYQHVREPAQPPSVYEPGLPPAVDAVLMASLAKQPAERYSSAEEMRRDLLAVLAGEPVAAPAAGFVDTADLGPAPAAATTAATAVGAAAAADPAPVTDADAARRNRRRKAGLAAAAAAVVVAGGLGALAFSGSDGDPVPGQRAERSPAGIGSASRTPAAPGQSQAEDVEPAGVPDDGPDGRRGAEQPRRDRETRAETEEPTATRTPRPTPTRTRADEPPQQRREPAPRDTAPPSSEPEETAPEPSPSESPSDEPTEPTPSPDEETAPTSPAAQPQQGS